MTPSPGSIALFDLLNDAAALCRVLAAVERAQLFGDEQKVGS